MRIYSIYSAITFGKYRGQTIRQVLAKEPDYLNFCMQQLTHFALRRAEVEAWVVAYPHLQGCFTPETWACIDRKMAEPIVTQYPESSGYMDESHMNDHLMFDDDFCFTSRNAERDTFDALTDGQCGDYNDWGGDMDSLRDGLGW